MDRETGEDILEVKGEVHKRTSVSSTKLGQKNEDRSRYIRLCYERSFIDGV